MNKALVDFCRSKATEVATKLRANMDKKGMVATGKTKTETIGRALQDGAKVILQVVGSEHVWDLEYGKAPGEPLSPEFISKIRAWLQAKNINRAPYVVARKISKEGTLLFSGKDPRFPGKKQSGVITEIVNEDLIKSIKLQAEKIIGNYGKTTFGKTG